MVPDFVDPDLLPVHSPGEAVLATAFGGLVLALIIIWEVATAKAGPCDFIGDCLAPDDVGQSFDCGIRQNDCFTPVRPSVVIFDGDVVHTDNDNRLTGTGKKNSGRGE